MSNSSIVPSNEIDIRSQRLSDTYPVRILIKEKSGNIFSNLYSRFVALYVLRPLISILFPRVLNNSYLAGLLGFRRSTLVTLLCPWTCEDGHICSQKEEHTGKHVCIFGHVEGKPILKCGSVCDCRNCDADCVYGPNHSGIHKCNFRHYISDIPSTRRQQESFRDDKAIGDYIDELVYVSPEEMKFSHIPQALKYEKWFEK